MAVLSIEILHILFLWLLLLGNSQVSLLLKVLFFITFSNCCRYIGMLSVLAYLSNNFAECFLLMLIVFLQILLFFSFFVDNSITCEYSFVSSFLIYSTSIYFPLVNPPTRTFNIMRSISSEAVMVLNLSLKII